MHIQSFLEAKIIQITMMALDTKREFMNNKEQKLQANTGCKLVLVGAG